MLKERWIQRTVLYSLDNRNNFKSNLRLEHNKLILLQQNEKSSKILWKGSR